MKNQIPAGQLALFLVQECSLLPSMPHPSSTLPFAGAFTESTSIYLWSIVFILSNLSVQRMDLVAL